MPLQLLLTECHCWSQTPDATAQLPGTGGGRAGSSQDGVVPGSFGTKVLGGTTQLFSIPHPTPIYASSSRGCFDPNPKKIDVDMLVAGNNWELALG